MGLEVLGDHMLTQDCLYKVIKLPGRLKIIANLYLTNRFIVYEKKGLIRHSYSPFSSTHNSGLPA